MRTGFGVKQALSNGLSLREHPAEFTAVRDEARVRMVQTRRGRVADLRPGLC